MLFSKSQVPSYAISAATLSSNIVNRVSATPTTAEVDNLMQFESQQPLKPVGGFRPIHSVSANLMDQTTVMDIPVVPVASEQDAIVEDVKENIPITKSTLADKTTGILSRSCFSSCLLDS